MIWDLVKIWVAPGSLAFMILLLVVGGWLLRVESTRKIGRIWTGFVVVSYLLLSLPWTAGQLAGILQGPSQALSQFDRVPQPISIVVWAGDHPESRIRETARLYAALHPQSVVLSGDSEMYQALIAVGVPADRIIREASSRTTREQAIHLGPVLRAHSINHFVLVASSLHMRRALATVRATGLCPIPSAAEVPRYRTATGLSRFLPQWAPLRLSEEALYECLALGYYRIRGWL